MESLFLMLVGGAAVLLPIVLWRRLFGFAAQKPTDYAQSGPDFDLRTHLNGPIQCEGVIYGPLGRVSSRFVGDFSATWRGDSGVMTETFHYDNGATQHREWHLDLRGNGRILATAPDVIGSGSGVQMGSAVKLTYRIRLPQDSGGHVLTAIDWMYLAPNGTIVNRSRFYKYGIQVAELVATMRPAETTVDRQREAA